jgi:hypothetical protein
MLTDWRCSSLPESRPFAREALDDLAVAREACGEAGRQYDESSLLSWVGVCRGQFLAAIESARRHPPPA